MRKSDQMVQSCDIQKKWLLIKMRIQQQDYDIPIPGILRVKVQINII